MPALGALTSISIFIASRTIITSPSAIESPIEASILNTLPGTPALTSSPAPEPVEAAADFSMPSLTETS